MKRPRPNSLLLRLLVAYLLPTLVLFALFGWWTYRVTERSLEQSLGRRLIGVAQAATTQIRPEAVLFLSQGDDESRTARRLQHKLELLRKRTRVARIFILDHELRSRCDTDPSVRIGDRYYHAEADRSELQRIFSRRGEASSVLFVGADGRFYKTGYAPVLQKNEAVAAVGVEGSVEFFTVLARLRNTLLLSGGVVALLVMLISAFVARRFTRPLRALAGEAARIGTGDLERPIEVKSSDEVGLLADTMNEMRQGLFERDQQMQMMLSGIAHEVRNPLGGIELFSGLLREELADDSDKSHHVERIERELTYLKKVVGDFLDYARRTQPTKTRIEISGLLGEIVELLHKDAAEREVNLEHDCPGQTWATGDPDQLKRVLINLTRNAVQASSAGGRVRLSCREEPEVTICEVSDDGAGIGPDVLERIFTPFFTTREKGTGLGLAFAKKIVDEHGGELTVRSVQGEGATFSIALPRGQDHGDDSDHR